MIKEEVIKLALDIVEDGEFGNFWREVNQEDLEVVTCDWFETKQEWIVRVRGWCPENGGAWLMSMALNNQGDLIGSIYDVED